MCAIYRYVCHMYRYECLSMSIGNRLGVLPTSDCCRCVVDQSLDTYMCAMYIYR